MARYIDADNLEELEQLAYNYEPKQEFPAVPWYKADDVWKILDHMDGADVTPVVHGRWELRGGVRYCSACEKKACVTRDSEDFWYTVGTAYCPNCGAKMDLEG